MKYGRLAVNCYSSLFKKKILHELWFRIRVGFQSRSPIFFFLFTWTWVRCYFRQTLSTRVRLARLGLEIFSRPSKAMKSNLSWRDLLRSYDFLIVRIFSFKRLYPSLLKIYASESQANPCLHEEVIKILTPSYLAYSGWPNPTLNTIVLNKTKLEFSV